MPHSNDFDILKNRHTPLTCTDVQNYLNNNIQITLNTCIQNIPNGLVKGVYNSDGVVKGKLLGLQTFYREGNYNNLLKNSYEARQIDRRIAQQAITEIDSWLQSYNINPLCINMRWEKEEMKVYPAALRLSRVPSTNLYTFSQTSTSIMVVCDNYLKMQPNFRKAAVLKMIASLLQGHGPMRSLFGQLTTTNAIIQGYSAFAEMNEFLQPLLNKNDYPIMAEFIMNPYNGLAPTLRNNLLSWLVFINKNVSVPKSN